MLRIFLASVLLTCGFLSCTQQSKEKMLIGKWKYKGMEGRDGKAVNLKDSMTNVTDKSNEGVILIFSQDKTFESGKEKNGSYQSFGKETWKLSDDQNFILTTGNNGRENKMQIISLTPDKFAFILNPSSEEYLVFVKTD